MFKKISSYQDGVDFLASLSSFNIVLGLETIRALCNSLNQPQTAFPSVLVAGTNGKGSVCANLASILKRSSYKTGLYTSPHLVEIRERIKIDDQKIPKDRFADLLDMTKNIADILYKEKTLTQYPTYFEFLTAVAFLWFKEEKVDIGVMEIGLGGRFDAVNIINPILSVITEIDYDHQKHLGKTLTAIAGEKAGIMRKGRPVILSVSKTKPRTALEKIAAEKNSVVFDVLKERRISAREIPASSAQTKSGTPINTVRNRMEDKMDMLRIVTPKNMYENLIPALPGRHQFGNIAAAVCAAEKLIEAGFNIKPEDINFGIENAHWEGRLQWIDWKKPLLLDGGHNPSGLRSLVDYLDRKLSSKKFSLIFACKTSKDYKKMCAILFPLAKRIFLPKIEGYQFVEPELLRKEALKLDCDSIPTGSLDEAFTKAVSEKDIDYILAAGSLHLVGEVLNYLDK